MTSIQHHWGFLNVFDKGQHHRFLHDTNKAWVSHYAIITKASKIRNWVERSSSQSSEYEKDKEGQEVQVIREDLIYGLN